MITTVSIVNIHHQTSLHFIFFLASVSYPGLRWEESKGSALAEAMPRAELREWLTESPSPPRFPYSAVGIKVESSEGKSQQGKLSLSWEISRVNVRARAPNQGKKKVCLGRMWLPGQLQSHKKLGKGNKQGTADADCRAGAQPPPARCL